MTTFTADAWQQNLDLYNKTLALPFNRDLSAGTLSEDRFRHYMIQDAHYLEGFGRALSIVSSKGWTADHIVHFAESAQVAIIVERSLHADYFEKFGISQTDFETAERSPVCEHYVSFLLATTALEPFEVGLAALLPCFWIYREVGKAIHAEAAKNNPYRAWIDTYSGEDFEASVDRVIGVIDAVAAETSARNIAGMHQAYKRSAQLEWMFWDSAYRLGEWPAG
ncbi:MAG: thiaminase II [Pseudomonadota bacterium]